MRSRSAAYARASGPRHFFAQVLNDKSRHNPRQAGGYVLTRRLVEGGRRYFRGAKGDGGAEWKRLRLAHAKGFDVVGLVDGFELGDDAGGGEVGLKIGGE